VPAQTRLEQAWRQEPPAEPADGHSPRQPGDHVPVPNSDDHRSGPDGGAGADGGLVGRQAMIGELADVLAAAGRSEGGAVVLHGPAGIGKSSLLAVAESAGRARGMLVLTAKGARTESDLPFAGLHQLFGPLLSGLTQLPARQAELLRSAFGDSAAEAARFGIALAALDLLAEAAARQPVLMLADDAHWLDGPSTDVLAFVGRRLAMEPVALLASVRDGEDDPFAAADLPVVRVGPLGDDAARALLRARYPGLPPAGQDRVLERAQGNPLALLELPKSAADALAPAALFVGDYPPAARHAALCCRLARVQGRLAVFAQLKISKQPQCQPDGSRSRNIEASVTYDGLAGHVDPVPAPSP
jgi:hypothetical protein